MNKLHYIKPCISIIELDASTALLSLSETEDRLMIEFDDNDIYDEADANEAF